MTEQALFSAVDFLGVPLSTVTSFGETADTICGLLADRRARSTLVTFVNPLSLRLIRKDGTYLANLRRMDVVLSDGIALTWAARWLGLRHLERISFDSGSLAPFIFRRAAHLGNRLMLIGGAPGVAEAAASRIREAYPTINIIGAIHGFAPTERIVQRTIASEPDIVICGMGMPRQEAVLVALADAGWTGCGFSCGGYLDQLVERFNYYPGWINRFNLRWLYRVYREPGRIGRRCVADYPPFLLLLARARLNRERFLLERTR